MQGKMGEKFDKVSYNQVFCSLLGFEVLKTTRVYMP